MSANVETMFYTRVTPWHGLGTRVEEAPDSREALILAGLDWQVIQKPIMTGDGQPIDGFKANIRDRDGQVLGVVTDGYKVVQNEDWTPSPLQMNCWVRALLMRRRAPCRRAAVPGFWQSSLSAISSAGMRLPRTWSL